MVVKTKNKKKVVKTNASKSNDLIFKEPGQEYAEVIKLLGNCRLEAKCQDGITRLCHIRGKLQKKVWITAGNTIIVGLRDFQDNKADVMHVYNNNEVRKLKNLGELTIGVSEETVVEEDGFDFMDL